VYRYRAVYSKLHEARFLSHLDLSSMIQRALRRGGFSVLYSEGFHPKIRISFCPALPLGMEGKAEVLEFKSSNLYTEDEFLRQINNFLPRGVKFLQLKRLEASEPGLNQSIEKMVYSFDLKGREIDLALEELKKEKKMASIGFEMIQGLVDEFWHNNQDGSVEDILLDEKKAKLYLTLDYSNQRRMRPQEIITNIFGLHNSVFHMAREKIVFKLTRGRDSSIRTSRI
jgi:radical SAM-linked protein